MPDSLKWLLVILFSLVQVLPVDAAEPIPLQDQMRAAVSRSLPLIEKASVGSAEQRECFTCHSQAMPVLTFVEARQKGFEINSENLARQVEHTRAHLERGRKAYQDGKGQGGRADTAGFALWTLSASGTPGDEVTSLVADWLLHWQSTSGHWSPSSRRPPTQTSSFTTTYLALRSLSAFATAEQQELFAMRRQAALEWLLASEPSDNEDRVFRLWALQLAGAEPAQVETAAAALLATQQSDGGWRQNDDLASDAYATGTALTVLLKTGCLPADHDAAQRGVKFLLENQQADGSWHVVTRSSPIQTYFETGFPHGEDQFISTSATCWATLALLEMLPVEQKSPR